MAEKFIPTMSIKGWIDHPEDKADYVIACFMESNHSMTVSHREQNVTLQFLLKKFANRMLDLETALQDVLDAKLKAAFNANSYANVDVRADETNPSQFTINFTGYVVTDDKTFTVGWMVQFQDSRVLKIAKINNGV
ncbi:hypothetical protein MZD04_gp064 [Pseudomonas phage Psa21]|uniref:Uncharacterized protein n=1 Tax=Pseudomonas phage Psa21 TaxID=2530023 RepID=A0A481W5D5_9CAUD|nr:hypothetical protein MZD04_gp064 [Pseudomonas phage Psa21]QBJ02593.1 hypothetical protein PSA21_64 [Pseudomonas phage Psa21]